MANIGNRRDPGPSRPGNDFDNNEDPYAQTPRGRDKGKGKGREYTVNPEDAKVAAEIQKILDEINKETAPNEEPLTPRDVLLEMLSDSDDEDMLQVAEDFLNDKFEQETGSTPELGATRSTERSRLSPDEKAIANLKDRYKALNQQDTQIRLRAALKNRSHQPEHKAGDLKRQNLINALEKDFKKDGRSGDVEVFKYLEQKDGSLEFTPNYQKGGNCYNQLSPELRRGLETYQRIYNSARSYAGKTNKLKVQVGKQKELAKKVWKKLSGLDNLGPAVFKGVLRSTLGDRVVDNLFGDPDLNQRINDAVRAEEMKNQQEALDKYNERY